MSTITFTVDLADGEAAWSMVRGFNRVARRLDREPYIESMSLTIDGAQVNGFRKVIEVVEL